MHIKIYGFNKSKRVFSKNKTFFKGGGRLQYADDKCQFRV